MQKLELFFDGNKIVDVTANSSFDLQYNNYWKENGFAISPHLPLNENIDSISIKYFLENLLPEGRGLEDIISYYRVSKRDVVSILKTVGFETSGALSFTKSSDNESFREVSKKELIKRVKEIDEISINFWDNKPRLSLAGVQDKLPVIYKDGKFGLADGKLSSTHILKFQTKRYQNIVLNEYLCLNLAKHCGLKVTNCEILKLDSELVLLVERFDRLLQNSEVKRLHLIDGCQLLDLPPSYKYERNFGSGRDVKHIRDGASFAKLFSAVGNTKIPAVSKLKLLDWALFNLLIGNSDAHGKNVSFFVSKNGIELAPFYDIISTIIIENIEHDLAMAFGDEFDIDNVLYYDLECFGKDIGLPITLIKNRMQNMIKKIESKLDRVDFNIELKKEESEFANRLKDAIRKRVLKMKEFFI